MFRSALYHRSLGRQASLLRALCVHKQGSRRAEKRIRKVKQCGVVGLTNKTFYMVPDVPQQVTYPSNKSTRSNEHVLSITVKKVQDKRILFICKKLPKEHVMILVGRCRCLKPVGSNTMYLNNSRCWQTFKKL